MVEEPAPSEAATEDDEARPRWGWEVPEVAVTVVLVATGVLALGELIAAVIFSTQTVGPGPMPGSFTGYAIVAGAGWASPLLAIALLGLAGVTWWQVVAWSDVVTDSDASASEAGATLTEPDGSCSGRRRP
jgi:hypothetical protein